MSTNIPWVRNPDGTKGEVWNPVRGCTPISEGCANCYAARFASRFAGPRLFSNKQAPYEGLANNGKWTGEVRVSEETLYRPTTWRKPRMVFVNSMSDLFHTECISNNWTEDVLEVISQEWNQRHTFVALTKRAGNMQAAMRDWSKHAPVPPNLWLGVSVENQARADERIPLLLQTPAAKRFVSIEPMLGPVDLEHVQWPQKHKVDVLRRGYWEDREVFWKGFVNHSDMNGLDWVICGCESGHGARPFDLDWARALRDQCQAAGVSFFFKQVPDPKRPGRTIEMPELDERVWGQMPARAGQEG